MEKTISLATVNHECRSLRAFFGKLVDGGYITDNPFRGIKIPKPEVSLPKVLMPNELRALLQVCSPPLQRAIRILSTEGFRVSEYLNLRWKDVDKDNGIIYVRANELTGFAPKTHWERIVRIHPRLDRVIGAPQDPNDLVCGKNMQGHVCDYDWIRRSFGRARHKVKLDRFSIHNLRATAATLAVASDPRLNVYKLMAQFGWKNMQTSMRYVSVSSQLFQKPRSKKLLPWES